MNADFLAMADFWEKEKGITKDVLLRAVQESLLAAAQKAVGPGRDLRVVIAPKSGDIKVLAKRVVSGPVVTQHDQISVSDAHRAGHAEAQVGDEIDVEVTPNGFGRIAAHYAKQALMSQVRKAEKKAAEKAKLIGEFKNGIVGNEGN